MASLSRSADGRSIIQFVGIDGKRRTLRLGRCDKRVAESTRLRVEDLLACRIQGVAPSRDLALWLSTVGDELSGRLAAVGLIEPRRNETLGQFTGAYIERRSPELKPRTVINLNQARTRLIEFFGEDRPLRSVSERDAAELLAWMRQRYANATTGRTVKRCRQFFAAAAQERLVEADPFASVKAPSMVNAERQVFIDRPSFQRALDATPDAETRLWLALCRFAGLRCPSETALLRWSDVVWDRDRFFVRSPKTAGHEGKEGRWVPIFADLRPYLSDQFDRVDAGEQFLLPRLRLSSNQSLRSRLSKILHRAGLDMWRKPFVNMRSSCESELIRRFPIATVCRWIGHGIAVAEKHYVQILDGDFQRAANSGAVEGEALQIPVQSAAAPNGQEESQVTGSAAVRSLLTHPDASCTYGSLPPGGLHPAEQTRQDG